jgi:hypothetical protein
LLLLLVILAGLLTIGIKVVRSLEFSTSICFPQLHCIAISLGADVVADNWDDLFDSGNDFVEQHYEQPIIADNWGGFFNDGEQYCVALDALHNNIHSDLLNSFAHHSHDHLFVLNPVAAQDSSAEEAMAVMEAVANAGDPARLD